jgi:hypothetical protein
MKQSTVESLRQFTDPEQIGNGKLRERIELLEKLAERSGNATVPYQSLLVVVTMSDWDIDIAGPVEEIKAEGASDPGDVGVGAQPSNDALSKKRIQMAIAREARNKKNHETLADA